MVKDRGVMPLGVMALTSFGPALKVIFCHLSDLMVKARGVMALTNFAPAFKLRFCHVSDLIVNARAVTTLTKFAPAFKSCTSNYLRIFYDHNSSLK